MNASSKQWQKPVLIVIGKARPDEQVLAICKLQGGNRLGPNNLNCKGTGQTGNCQDQVS